ncbi:hypothetical protein CLAFUW4_00643 [Fulvia fulva]|uniref:Uncharacterized protein n=1 Tax=Passalora fulva TaxID=5499 RepID=A0A9Q8L7D7_PASFU|nr:uncharacterized protein CLAFUR5_00642 [Fulvia fulva]KAK4635400.1 hypothetical protein CLAFUR4_00644 [Fulvia fulva]KAK4636589.1 hypothetical protein CLAFUR0_00645 [Fulvia fulva]UJO12217.1 hypothetical protein CLAFUR5_00642 [Fulvia fulva]WPV08707.1 hypothetical protein CLAFUW4_00643 [Fulvia fulva]WPV23137.1 hypothetical protein CLAFUW7_00648 [Fulvia fulva]
MAAPGHHAHHLFGSAAGLATLIITIGYGAFADYQVATDTRAIITDSSTLVMPSPSIPLAAAPSASTTRVDNGFCYPLNGTGVTWSMCVVPHDYHAVGSRFAAPLPDWFALCFFLLLCLLSACCLVLIAKAADALSTRIETICRRRSPRAILRLYDYARVAYASYTQTVALASIIPRLLSQDIALPWWTTPALLLVAILSTAWYPPQNKLEIAHTIIAHKDEEIATLKASLCTSRTDQDEATAQLEILRVDLEVAQQDLAQCRGENARSGADLHNALRANRDLSNGLRVCQQELHASKHAVQGLESILEDLRIAHYLQKHDFQRHSLDHEAQLEKKLGQAQSRNVSLREENRRLHRKHARCRSGSSVNLNNGDTGAKTSSADRQGKSPELGVDLRDHKGEGNIPTHIQRESEAAFGLEKGDDSVAVPVIELSLDVDTTFSNSAVIPSLGEKPSVMDSLGTSVSPSSIHPPS